MCYSITFYRINRDYTSNSVYHREFDSHEECKLWANDFLNGSLYGDYFIEEISVEAYLNSQL